MSAGSWTVLVKLIVILLIGIVPSLLDSTIVNVAITTIGRDLHTSVSAIGWVITGYLLSFGMVIPLSGWALARFGGRATWSSRWWCSWPGRCCRARPGTSAP